MLTLLKKTSSFFLLQLLFIGFVYGQPVQKPNILFIAIDDLNDWTGFLHGHPQIKTPNMDALAAQSVSFSRAYCNSPSCNPSRSSLLLGKHPHSLGFYRITEMESPYGTINMRKYWPDKKTIPQYFKDNGYSTHGTGKIFHEFADRATTAPYNELSFEEYGAGSTKINTNEKIPWQSDVTYLAGSYKDYGPIDSAHSKFGDYDRASIAISYINKPHTKPFFIACGFYLPHLPWFYPKSIMDSAALAHIKDYNNVMLPPVLENDLDDLPPSGVKAALNGGVGTATWNGKVYPNMHAAFVASGKWKEAIQAYIASIYFMDLQLGRVLKAFNASPYKDNTIIVVWSDHGWMLGHKQGWEKFKPWEQSVRVPFLFKVPGIKPTVIKKPVELLSIYPTLIDLTGIPKKDGVDGISLKPLMENPDMEWNYPVVTAQRESTGGWQTVRTQRYRYIRYMQNGEEELYDHNTDSLEWYNLASNPALVGVKQELNSYLPKEWTPLGSWNNWKMPVVSTRSYKKPDAEKPLRILGNKVHFPLKMSNPSSLKIFDITGKLLVVLSKEALTGIKDKGYFEVPTTIAGPKAYIIHVVAGNQVFRGKFVPVNMHM